MNADVTIDR